MNTMNAAAQPALATITSPTTMPMPMPMPIPEHASTGADTRLCHLFRATLKNGRIHPLYLPMLKYRHAKPHE